MISTAGRSSSPRRGGLGVLPQAQPSPFGDVRRPTPLEQPEVHPVRKSHSRKHQGHYSQPHGCTSPEHHAYHRRRGFLGCIMHCWQPLPAGHGNPPVRGVCHQNETGTHHIYHPGLCTICSTSFKQGHTARFTLPSERFTNVGSAIAKVAPGAASSYSMHMLPAASDTNQATPSVCISLFYGPDRLQCVQQQADLFLRLQHMHTTQSVVCRHVLLHCHAARPRSPQHD